MPISKVEYRIRKVDRFIVTRYHEDDDGAMGCEQKGEHENSTLAHEIAYALARDEHERLGWPIGDERMQYPKAADLACPALTLA